MEDKKIRTIKFRAWSKVLKLMTYDLKMPGIRISDNISDSKSIKGSNVSTDFKGSKVSTGSKDVKDIKDVKYMYLNETIDHYQDLFDLMQFIGYKDKYGREIYEGDIVKWKYHYNDEYQKSDEIIGVVEWNEIDCGFNIRQLTNGFYDCGCGSKEKLKFYGDRRNFKFEDLQIIGNVYKSPELLNIEEKIKEDKKKEEKMKGIEIRKITK